MAIYRRVVDCESKELEAALTDCYADGAFSIEERDLPDGRLRLLVYFQEPVPGALPVDESIDWQSISEQPWKAIGIGERLWLAPPWVEEDAPPGRMRLNYIRGQACGTGGHGATQACLAAMDNYLKPGESFLDVGCGSGILSVAADLLSAELIVGCDIDHPSVVLASQTCAAPLFTGSTKSVRSESFDVVAANVNATVLGYIGEDLTRILRSGGRLIAGGFKTSEAPALPIPEIDRFAIDGWCATVHRR